MRGHWQLFAVHFEELKIVSMDGKSNTALHAEDIRKLKLCLKLTLIRRGRNSRTHSRRGTHDNRFCPNMDAWSEEACRLPWSAQQMDGSTCGPLVCTHMKAIAEELRIIAERRHNFLVDMVNKNYSVCWRSCLFAEFFTKGTIVNPHS